MKESIIERDSLFSLFDTTKSKEQLKSTVVDCVTHQLNEIQQSYVYPISNDKFCVKCGHSLHFINCNSIYYLKREGKKTIIHTVTNTFETFESLNAIEKRLNPAYFYRSHKCYIINLFLVTKIEPWGNKTYLISFENEKKEAWISRSKIKTLYELVGLGKSKP